MNTTILGGSLMLIVCQAFVVSMFFVARRKQETTTIEILPELYLQAFAVATTSIEESRHYGKRLSSRKG